MFAKLLHKNEEKQETEKPTMIEELYQTRKLNLTPIQETTNNFDNIMEKMAQMKNSVEEYREGIQAYKKEDEKESVTENTIRVDVPNEDMQETKIITEEMKQELAQVSKDENTQVINVEEIRKSEDEAKETEEKFEDMYTSVFGKAPIEEKTEVKEDDEEYKMTEMEVATGENLSMFNKEEQTIPPYKFIGIAFSTYIIIELDKELYIIDQHAAHERIMYEKVKENYYKDGEKDSQLMLLPDIITLTHKEMDIAKENMEMFRKAGFMLEEFGENTIKLMGVPNICLELDTKELFLETLDEINTVARTAKQEVEEKFIATVACKAAVKANMALSKEEVDSLMRELLILPNPFTCPHGRPTAIKMTKTDIEKKFSRR